MLCNREGDSPREYLLADSKSEPNSSFIESERKVSWVLFCDKTLRQNQLMVERICSGFQDQGTVHHGSRDFKWHKPEGADLTASADRKPEWDGYTLSSLSLFQTL